MTDAPLSGRAGTNAGEPELQYAPDPHTWLIGPTSERPREVWVPGAVDVLTEDFGVSDADTRRYIQAVLERFAADETSELTESLLRWRSVADVPLPMFLGMVESEHWRAEDLQAYLEFDDEPIVEPAVVETVGSTDGVSIRRSTGYSHYEEGLMIGVRYCIEVEDNQDLVAVMYSASGTPGHMIEALEDFDDLARTVRVLGSVA